MNWRWCRGDAGRTGCTGRTGRDYPAGREGFEPALYCIHPPLLIFIAM